MCAGNAFKSVVSAVEDCHGSLWHRWAIEVCLFVCLFCSNYFTDVGLCLHACMGVTCMSGVHWGQMKVLDPLELLSCHVESGNQT